jgi:hypothetical protein
VRVIEFGTLIVNKKSFGTEFLYSVTVFFCGSTTLVGENKDQNH